jgi:hypothetical protein
MEIKVLGPGCANCKRLYAEAEKAIARSGQSATLDGSPARRRSSP